MYQSLSLHTCGKQSEFRDFAIISRALLFLNSQPLSGAILPKIKACTFIYVYVGSFSTDAQAGVSLRCSHMR